MHLCKYVTGFIKLMHQFLTLRDNTIWCEDALIIKLRNRTEKIWLMTKSLQKPQNLMHA